jgi:hypothetical protein
MSNRTGRSYLDLTPEECVKAFETGSFPEDVTFEGVDFAANPRLFRHRDNPKNLAAELLRIAGHAPPKSGRTGKVQYIPATSTEERQKKLELKEREISLREIKAHNQTEMFQIVKDIRQDVSEIKDSLRILSSDLERLTQIIKRKE